LQHYEHSLKIRLDAKGAVRGGQPQGVQGAAEQVLHPESLTWLIVGDRAQIETQLRELGLGEVQIIDVDGQIVE